MNHPRRDRIDLHTHTTASDGKETPAELLANASRQGITVLAITDHDSVGSLDAAMDEAEPLGITLVPGVELSTTTNAGEVHVLGYFVNPADNGFVARLRELADGRFRRVQRIIARLHDLGLAVDGDRILAQAERGSVGRPHVAAELIRIGAARNVQDAFDRLLGTDRPAYVEREPFTPEQAVSLLADHHAIPVLAHPYSTLDPVSVAQQLIPFGLKGFETYYADYSVAQHAKLRAIADDLGLIPTGGSDYHGVGFRERRQLGAAPVPHESYARLAELANAMAGQR